MMVMGAIFWSGKASVFRPSKQSHLRERFAHLKGINILSAIRQVSGFLFFVLREITQFFTQLLEGEGGIIWSLVILALFISLIGGGG